MSKDVMSKIRANDVWRGLARVLSEYRIEDYDVADVRPHPTLTVRYVGLERTMSFPGSPSGKGSVKKYVGDLRRLLKSMQMENLSAPKTAGAAPRLASDATPAAPHSTAGSETGPDSTAARGESNPVVVSVGGKDVTRVEYRGQPVLTLRQIDELHERPEGTASRQFRENRARFEIGRDFNEINADEFRRSFPDLIGSRGGGTIFLITARGYAKIIKGWNDDRSWEVYLEMHEVYFTIRETAQQIGVDVTSIIQAISAITDGQKMQAEGIIGAVCRHSRDKVVPAVLEKVVPAIASLDALEAYVKDMREKSYERDVQVITSVNALIAKLNTMQFGGDPMAFNPADYCDVDAVYQVAGIRKDIPRRAMLSRNVSTSLDSFFKAQRAPSGSLRYDMRQITVRGRPVNIWHGDGVNAWLRERGREIIGAHIQRYTPSTQRQLSLVSDRAGAKP